MEYGPDAEVHSVCNVVRDGVPATGSAPFSRQQRAACAGFWAVGA